MITWLVALALVAYVALAVAATVAEYRKRDWAPRAWVGSAVLAVLIGINALVSDAYGAALGWMVANAGLCLLNARFAARAVRKRELEQIRNR